MFMEFATGVEGSTAYLCYFNKKRLIKILHSWGINDFREFLKNYIWDDTDAMMCEFEDRGWSYKKVACEFQSEKYQSEYIDLFEEIVVNKIFKHFGIDPQDNETIVGYFAKENSKWIVWFNEPEATATFEDILNGNYSSLKELIN